MTTLWVTASDAALADAIARVDGRPTGHRAAGHAVGAGSSTSSTASVARLAAYYAHLDRFSFPEGGVFWTRGEAATEVCSVPGPGRHSSWRGSRPGPSAARARSWSPANGGGSPRAWRTSDSSSPACPGVEGLPVRLAFDGGFRPSEVEPGSTDARWLGCG
jgi:hypothetical protein